MIELLAPAGDEKSFFAAINSGANAIYLGLSDFSARKNAQNFTSENIAFFVSYAHALDVKVYLAVNTLIKDNEIDKFLNTVSVGVSVGIDAFILQDLFLSKLLKDNFPSINLHLSTQAGINNVSGAKIAKDAGFSRVILARETPLSEIKKITEIIETETFAHGALCTSFSGHCYMSAYVGGNSGNRGLCKQPCRKQYRLESKNGGKYPISLSDLCLTSQITTLKEAGVKSIKIEGRMRSPEYVASAVSTYRAILDGKNYNLSNLKRSFNRGDYTLGYLYGIDKNIVSDKIQNNIGETIGVVKSVKGDNLTVYPKLRHLKGDAFKIISNGEEVGNAVCLEDGNVLKFKGNVKIGDSVNITKDTSLSDKLFSNQKRKKIFVTVSALEGERLCLSSQGITLYSDEIIESAKSSKTTKEEIVANLLKTDKYPFEIESTVNVSNNPFIPKSTLNRLRSSLYEKIFFKDVKHLKNNYIIEENKDYYVLNYENLIISNKCIKVGKNDAFIYRPDDYSKIDEIKNAISINETNNYLFVPAFLTEKDEKEIINLLPLFCGIYADGIAGISIAKNYSKKLILGLGINLFNTFSINQAKIITNDLVLSQELSFNEILKMDKNSGYCFSFGSIRLMELLYCPFGKDCKNCNRNKNSYFLTDEKGRKFKINKYILGGRCRFEVYNEELLFAKRQTNNLINLIDVNEDLLYTQNNEYLPKNIKITAGNTKRGVL